jgi:1,4-dihydroxy-2-naphthoate octaprenyltransferase
VNPWWVAARPYTLPAAVVPVLVGSGTAVGVGTWRLDAFLAALIGSIAIQVSANFANDVSDAARGADSAARTGPPRMVASGVISPARMWTAVWVSITVAGLAGTYLIVVAGWVVALIGVGSILAMLGYVGGPVPYGYRGLGEVFVFVFFGVVATAGSRYVHDQAVPMAAWLLSIPVGLMVTAILVANNLRDIATDTSAGKRTLAVIIGPGNTRHLFVGLVWGTFGLVAAFATLNWIPREATLALLVSPLVLPVVRAARIRSDGPGLIMALKGTARLHLLVGIALALGAALG